MKIKNAVLTSVISATMGGGLVLFAQAPVVSVGPKHGNLRSAQQYIVQAYQKLEAARSANEDQLGGHAQKAMNLLSQADAELRFAANTSNTNGR
ncbi:MAG: hypothetical protein WDN23_06080 [Edaphobacter sp.]